MITKYVGFLGSYPSFLPVGFYLTIFLMTITSKQVRRRRRRKKKGVEEGRRAGVRKEEREGRDSKRRGGMGSQGRRREKRKNVKKEEISKRQCRTYNLNQKFLEHGLMLNCDDFLFLVHGGKINKKSV